MDSVNELKRKREDEEELSYVQREQALQIRESSCTQREREIEERNLELNAQEQTLKSAKLLTKNGKDKDDLKEKQELDRFTKKREEMRSKYEAPLKKLIDGLWLVHSMQPKISNAITFSQSMMTVLTSPVPRLQTYDILVLNENRMSLMLQELSGFVEAMVAFRKFLKPADPKTLP